MDLISPLKEERGVSIAKTLIALVIIGAGLFVGIKYVLIKVHYLSIKDTVRAQAESAAMYDDIAIRREIIARAGESRLRIRSDDIRIDRMPGDRVTISLSYQDSLPLLVKTVYFNFDIEESSPLIR